MIHRLTKDDCRWILESWSLCLTHSRRSRPSACQLAARLIFDTQSVGFEKWQARSQTRSSGPCSAWTEDALTTAPVHPIPGQAQAVAIPSQWPVRDTRWRNAKLRVIVRITQVSRKEESGSLTFCNLQSPRTRLSTTRARRLTVTVSRSPRPTDTRRSRVSTPSSAATTDMLCTALSALW